MRLKTGAAAVLTAALLSAPAAAQPASAGPAAEPSVALVQTWVAQAATWVAGQQNTFVAEEKALTAVSAGAAQALAFFNGSRIKEGAAWSLDWAAARRLELANLKTMAHDAGAAAPPLPEALGDIPTLKAQDAALRDLSRRQADILRVGLGLADEIVDLAQKAASGDAEAARKLEGRRYDMAEAMLRGENLLVEASNSTLSTGDPQRDIGRAAISGNLAVMALIESQKRAAAGDAAGAQASARELRAQATAMQAAARQAPQSASARAAQLKARADMAGSAFGARVEAVLATYGDSADVESGIAQILLTIAERLEKGEAPSSPSVQRALAGMNPLVQRRIELDLKRKSILSGRSS